MIYSAWQRVWLVSFLLMSLVLSGCATTGVADSRDPFEGFNRGIHSFNKTFDSAIIEPVSGIYRAITPDVVDRGISNFFSNVNDISVVANDLLQFKIAQAFSDAARFIFNTTLGLLGFFDVASHMDLPKHNEDFGQTLGAWGVGPGPYLVAPFFGPTSLRDTTRFAVDAALLSPIFYLDNDLLRAGLLTINYVDFKSDLISTTELVEEAAIDEYEFIKNAYLERRENQVNDREFSEFEE